MKAFNTILIFGLIFCLTFNVEAQKRFVKKSNSTNVTFSTKPVLENMTKNAVEIVEKRDRFAKHFRDNNGQNYAIISSGDPFHYNKNGKWAEIINKIENNNTDKNSDYQYSNSENDYQTYFSNDKSKGLKLVFAEGEISEWQGMYYTFKDEYGVDIDKIYEAGSLSSSIDNNIITYSQLYNGVDARFTLNNSGKKQEYFINNSDFISSSPANAKYIVFYENVIIPKGWKYEVKKYEDSRIKSEIFVYDEAGKTILKYESPLCYDSYTQGKKRKRYLGEYDVKEFGGSLIIGIKVALEWLRNQDLTYPVIVDPTTNCYPSNSSNWTGWVNDDLTKTSGSIWTGWFDGSTDDDWEDGWAKFDVTSITDGSGISSIDLHLFQYGFWGVDIDVDIVQLTNDPVARSASNLFNDIEYASVVYNSIGDSPGFEDYSSGVIDWTIPLSSDATSYMQSSSLAANWFALGLYSAYSYGYLYGSWGPDDSDEALFYGYADASYKPYIRVTYCTPPTGYTAGSDQELCSSSIANIQTQTGASIGTGTSCQWSVQSGSAGITTPTSISTSVGSIGNGSNTFRLTVYDATGLCSVTDDVIIKNSIPTTASAGNDAYSCDGTYTMEGNNPVYGTGVWTVSSGAGIFADNTKYNSVVSNLNAGNNTFTWTISNGTGGMCTSSDNVIINYASVTTANAGSNQTLCSSSATFAGNAPGGGETGTWSLVSGAGTITTPSSNTSTVTSLGEGANSFRWTITHSASGCTAQDVVVITNNLPTIANAGPDQTISGTTTTLSGNQPTSGTGTWSVSSGPGSVTTPSAYNSGVTGITGTTVYTWTITNGSCPGNPSSDNVSIYYDPGMKGLIINGDFTNNGTFDHTNDLNYFYMDGTSKLIDGTSGSNNYIDAKMRVYGTITYDGVISNGKFSKTWVAGTKTFAIQNARTYKNHWFTNDGTTTLNASSVWENSNHWINNNTVSANATSTVKFNGSAAQNVTSGGSVFGNVEIVNTVSPSATDGVILQDDMSLNSSSTLTMNDGILIANSHNAVVNNIANTAVNYGGSNSSYNQSWVYGTSAGTLRRYIANSSNGEHAFPVGTASRGNLALLTNNSFPNAAGMYVDCYFRSGAIAGINTSFPSGLNEWTTSYTDVLGGGASEGVWVLNKNATGIDGTYDLKLYFNGFSGSLSDNKFCILSRLSDPGDGSTWEIPSGSTYVPELASAGFAYRKSMNSFSEKAIGRTAEELPVELLYFNSSCNDSYINLSWATASEIDNDYFVIESSNDMITWSMTEIVQGAGNSNEEKEYSYKDFGFYNSINYYRLKQVDYNGDYTYYGITSSECYSKINDNISVVNNYNIENITVNLKDMQGEELTVYLIDNVGRYLSNKKILVDSESYQYEISRKELGIGIYNLVFVTSSKIIPKQIVITNN